MVPPIVVQDSLVFIAMIIIHNVSSLSQRPTTLTITATPITTILAIIQIITIQIITIPIITIPLITTPLITIPARTIPIIIPTTTPVTQPITTIPITHQLISPNLLLPA